MDTSAHLAYAELLLGGGGTVAAGLVVHGPARWKQGLGDVRVGLDVVETDHGCVAVVKATVPHARTVKAMVDPASVHGREQLRALGARRLAVVLRDLHDGDVEGMETVELDASLRAYAVAVADACSRQAPGDFRSAVTHAALL